MNSDYGGGCLCGGVRYRCSAKPIHTFFCHCVDCQRETGGPFATEIYLPIAAIVLNGTVRRYTRIGDSGHPVHRHFCPKCGSVVLTTFEIAPAFACLKACSLDDPSWVTPEFHLYVSSKPSWSEINDGLPQYERDF
jgi:hypothetical protein